MPQTLRTDIDIGLHVLCILADDDQTLSAEDIAEVCGCSNYTIYKIQADALRKARVRALRVGLNDFLT